MDTQPKAPPLFLKKPPTMAWKSFQQFSIGLLALALSLAIIVSLVVVLHNTFGSSTQPIPPTSAILRVTANGHTLTGTTLDIPSGTQVTLSVIPNHSLTPFQTYTEGIYAQDPYSFSELQSCTYPNTNKCTYTLGYSSSEQTDYSRGTHTFTAFLGDIGGSITYNSDDITIT